MRTTVAETVRVELHHLRNSVHAAGTYALQALAVEGVLHQHDCGDAAARRGIHAAGKASGSGLHLLTTSC